MSNQQKHLYEFGNFQLDADERMLLRAGAAITLAPKTFDLLLALVERPGHLLDKDELLRTVWPDAFVEETNLTSNISLLRKALGENGDGQRFIETVPKRGYRFVAEVKRAEPKSNDFAPVNSVALSPPTPVVVAPVLPSTFQRYKKILVVATVTGLLLTVAALAVWSRQAITISASPSKLWRATFEAGLQSEPTWSPDGNFLAFSSDQAGNFDIWARPAGEGDAVQVTKSPAHDWQPDWSPVDNTIVFRSERDGGGLYVIPALGGTERRIANFGYHPRWSPDGSQILFLDTINLDISERRRIFVVGLNDKTPREILTDALHEFIYLSGLTWHPDGARVTFWGQHPQQGTGVWTVPVAGGAPVLATVADAVKEQFKQLYMGFANNPYNLQWSPDGGTLYFEGSMNGIRNLWRVSVDPTTLHWVGRLERVTVSPGVDRDMRLSRDGRKLAFAVRTESRRLWALPFQANTGIITGAAQPLTPMGRDTVYFDLAHDGQKIAYFVEHGQQSELRERSLRDGTEKVFISVPGLFRPWSRWSRDGKYMVYRYLWRVNNRTEYGVGVLDVHSNEDKLLTALTEHASCLMTDWTADNQALLGSIKREPNYHSAVALFPVAAAPEIATQARILADNPEYNLWSPRFSPDEKWIVFNATKLSGGQPSQLFVIPATGGTWVPLTDGTVWSDKPRWSPDGKIIYFVANRAGFLNVWGIRFDPQAGRPVGEPFGVTTLESPSRMLTMHISGMQIGVSADRLIVPLTEVSGNVWVLENFAP